MYTYEDRIKAVRLYLKLGRRLGATIRKLGYPTKNTLIGWYREYLANQDLKAEYDRSWRKFSVEHKHAAVQHYLDHGRCMSFTLRGLGYPSRETLRRWIDELHPDVRLRMVGRAPNVLHPMETKKAALIELSTRTTSAEAIAKKNKVCRPTLYNWKNELIGPEVPASMKRHQQSKKDSDANADPNLTSTSEHINLLQQQVDALEHTRAALLKRQLRLSEKVILRLMKQESLQVTAIKKRRYGSYLGEISPAADNVINRDFQARVPNEKWLTDLTEFHIPAGKVYLSPMIDCFDGLVVSWTLGTRPDAELSNAMLDTAIESVTSSESRPVVHSDRGAHYRWPGWITRMNSAKLTRSMSRKGCSTDNAACEGFFGRLKSELFYPRDWQGVTIEQFIRTVDAYIRWYNEERIKVSLGSLSPVQYRESLGLLA
jgi:putative transposase